MMGERLVMQESLFYEFRLEDHVPSDHLLRSIEDEDQKKPPCQERLEEPALS